MEEIAETYPSMPARVQRMLLKRLPQLSEYLESSEVEAAESFKFTRPAGDPADARKSGYNSLFIGHSYFVPIVSQIGSHAYRLGLTDHQQFTVFNGGPSGSPGRLWSNEKASAPAKELIRTGGVELLAMTAHYVGSELKDYQKWMDLAIEHNPDTVFVIQSPWPEKREKTFEEYSQEAQKITSSSSQLIEVLREKYPNSTILRVPQNEWMLELWKLYEAGDLPELTELIAADRNESKSALFRDNHGHGGQLAVQDGALLWLRVLYGIDLEKYAIQRMTKFDTRSLAQNIVDNDPTVQ